MIETIRINSEYCLLIIMTEIRMASPSLKRRHVKTRNIKVKVGKITETEEQHSVQTTTKIEIIS